MHRISRFFSVIFICVSVIAAYTLDQIVDPRPGSWILDEKNYLAADSRSALEFLCKAVKDSNVGEIMVIVVDSIGSDAHRKFATDIFNKLGIGNRSTNRGVLIYAAIEERAAEIILGDSIDDDKSIALSNSIMQEHMIPHFKNGKYDNALYYGALECANQILEVNLSRNSGEGTETDSQKVSGNEQSSPEYVNNHQTKHPAGIKSIFANLLVFGGLLYLIARPFLRYIPRRCAQCGKKMRRLKEKEDDAFLVEGEQIEEQLKSVNYDIWYCADCKETKKVKNGKFFSSYSKCPMCKFKTVKTKTHTIHRATTCSTGLREVRENCQKCSYSKTFTETIPEISSSSNNSSSGSSGGGSSSGGGASGRW
jgi:uncharacterized protein